MTDATSWRDDYRKIAAQMINSSPEISLREVAARLDMAPDLVADILARTHPLSPVLERWRATKPGYGWAALERTNA